MSGQVDITEAQRTQILALLDKHLPNTAARVYGSRAKGKARPKSDSIWSCSLVMPKAAGSTILRKPLRRATCRFAWTPSCGIPPPGRVV